MVRPRKKRVQKLEKQDKLIPTKAELAKEDKFFKRITKKLDKVIRPAKISKRVKKATKKSRKAVLKSEKKSKKK